MKQKKLFRTIEAAASEQFADEKELLSEVVRRIVNDDNINVTGGRVWELDVKNNGYRLIFQTGNVQKINDNYILSLDENPIMKVVTRERTILANETDEYLKKKGIFKYSASGVGPKIKCKNDLYYQYLIALNSNEVDEELRTILNLVATVLTAKIKERRISASRNNLIADIDRARQIQKSILPEHELSFRNYDLFGVTVPAEIVGGDFYDYVPIGTDDYCLAVVVGDAASKGLSAAAEAMYISGAIRMASTFQVNIRIFMYRMNKLVNKIFSDDKFASLFYGELYNDKRGIFLYSNAGHNPPIFVRKRDKKVIMLEPTGPVLGPTPNSKYETDSINFHEGDVLVIYSDGIVEAANDKYEFYEEQRLIKIIKKYMHLTPKEITYNILEDVMKFSTKESKYQDDKTVVVIKRKENNVNKPKNK